MIVKIGQELKWELFVRQDKLVKALKMREDFMVETYLDKAFLEGKRGDFLVEVAPGIRFPCPSKHFLESFVPIDKNITEDRRSGQDRRIDSCAKDGKSGPGGNDPGGL
jgi:hypothetical protein